MPYLKYSIRATAIYYQIYKNAVCYVNNVLSYQSQHRHKLSKQSEMHEGMVFISTYVYIVICAIDNDIRKLWSFPDANKLLGIVYWTFLFCVFSQKSQLSTIQVRREVTNIIFCKPGFFTKQVIYCCPMAIQCYSGWLS